MNIAALQTLQLIAEHGSFSKAARVQNLTQPAISKRVAKLETYYGVKLLERSGHAIYITEFGHTLLKAHHDIHTRLNTVKNELDTLRSEITGTLNIIASHHISLHRMPPTLKRFCDLHPNVSLNISFSDSEIAYQKIGAGEADFGVVTLAPRPVDKVSQILLWNDPLAFMAASNHRLTTEQQTIENIAATQAVLPGMGTYTGQLVKALFDAKALPLSANMETNYLETIKMMVSVGLGWTMLPKSMLDDSVQEIHIDGIALSRQLGIIYRDSYQPTPAAIAFFNLLKESSNSTTAITAN